MKETAVRSETVVVSGVSDPVSPAFGLVFEAHRLLYHSA